MTTEEVLQRIGKNIKHVREEKGIAQQDLAALCNYEKSNMSRIESGRSNFTIGTLNKISNALGIEIGDLLK